ncbi:hypothetical protein [Paenibacillus sedimenti]|uniref:Uncharacterized protein n=1 Tax=Paenibacillus sedimenti TaxID=2770274 RepID=A0A926QLD1_9BACL|nr:hypothetical protein [Paenibacillus sedimenti]MBD0382723.1 hypothetical protein [Paenibacillus sedimenti]
MKRPLKVISASLGLLLTSQLLLVPLSFAENSTPSSTPAAGTPKLVEWSSEEVKTYFDAAVDWSLPIQAVEKAGTASPTPSPTPAAGSTGGGNAPIIVNQGYGGGFGWDDLLLYHLIFNSGSPYSSSSWVSSHPSYHYRSNTPYVTKTYQGTSFSNRSVTKSPTTSSGTGSFTTNKSSASTTTGSSVSSSSSSSSSKSTSTSTGSIGGKSSSFSSSSSSSSGG